MSLKAKWIKPKSIFTDVCPMYVKTFTAPPAAKAALTLTALGVYEAVLNGTRISDYVLAPGWTSPKRLQYQEYDISHLLQENNTLEITVGRGWYRSPLASSTKEHHKERMARPPGIIASIDIKGAAPIETDESWQVQESAVRFSELYDGEHYDASFSPGPLESVEIYPGPDCNLVPQQGEIIREIDRLKPKAIKTTPKGETVIDFGQNLTGYVEFSLPSCTKAGADVALSFAEVLDKEGNFYTENYRQAKSKLSYVSRDGEQSYKPKLTFFGFRYIRLDKFPANMDLNSFTAIAVHSDMKRTGWLECSNPLLNRLFENVIWGQKGNFLDIPTDCPQRDERLGWTGDAQAFIKTASYNYDVERFFTKWLADLALEQLKNGAVTHVVPDIDGGSASAAWADAATICPWQIYLTYGNKAILENQFDSMCKWVDYITNNTKDAGLWISFDSDDTNVWTGETHFGDWLSLEMGKDDDIVYTRGASRADFIASAFYAYSTKLVVKAGKVIGRDVSAYEALYERIVSTFRKTYTDYRTQTEHALILQFELAEDPQAVADALAKKVVADGSKLQTGFVGTPYMLHVLSKYGHEELAYTLLLRQEYPSWLYPVTKGATTVWERWDSIKPNGDFQSSGMNSFNHYAYGAVADWVYGVAAGIQTVEEYPGFAQIRIEPKPDARLGWLSARIETRHGLVHSKWQYTEGGVRYDITTPSPGEICIGGQVYIVDKGCYTFFA